MELQGTVKTVGAIEERGANNFKIAKVILDRTSTYQGQEYPNFAKVTFQGKKTDLLEERNIAPGDFVKVDGDLQGRFFIHNGEEKFAQDFVAWKLEILRKHIVTDAKQPPQTPPQENTNGVY